MGLEADHEGVIDLIEQQSITFDGEKGENIKYGDVPEEMKETVEEKRKELIERLADVDDELAEFFLMEEIPDVDTIKAAIRRSTIACTFVPVFMGSAFKNKGVQPLLDGVLAYLPQPDEKENFALDLTKEEEPVVVTCNNEDPLLALAFKLDETQYGQLTYMRVYQGMLRRGNYITNVKTGKKVKLARIVRMHSDDMEEIDGAGAGEVVAMFGVDCGSMDTFSDGPTNLVMKTMFVPVS
jgi:elongation factor G